MVMKIFRSRKFTRRVLIGILILILPAFVLWGVGSMSQGPEVVGYIDGKKINTDDLADSRKAVRAQVLFTYYGNPDTMREILQNQPMVNFMAWERLILLEAARRDRIKVSNREVMEFLANHPLFQRNGVFDKEIYDYLLRNNLSIEPRQFEELVRENLQVKRFRQGILETVEVTDEELLGLYKEANDKVTLSYLVIDKEDFSGEITVTEEEVRDYHEEHSDIFFEPEKVELDYVELSYGTADEKEDLISKLEEIYPSMRDDPASFRTIAEKSGFKYGATGPFTRNDVIPGITFKKGLHDLAFSLENGAVSPPVFAPSAPEEGKLYIFRKTGDIPRRYKDFDEVREDVYGIVKETKAMALAKKTAETLYPKLSGGETTLEEIAETLGTQVSVTPDVAISDYIENVGPAADIVPRALDTAPGGIMAPVTVKKGVFIARVDGIIPADETSFNEQKEAFRNNLLIRKQIAAIEEWFRQNDGNVQLKKPLEKL